MITFIVETMEKTKHLWAASVEAAACMERTASGVLNPRVQVAHQHYIHMLNKWVHRR